MTLRLYIDDDSGARALADRAQKSSITLVRSDEAGLRGASDNVHMAFAAENGLVLVTANARDFVPLHWQWMAQGRHHSGLIIATQGLSVGERIRRLLEFCTAADPDDLVDTVFYLTQWS